MQTNLQNIPQRARKRVAVAQLGARMHYAVPRLLYANGRLAHVYSDVYGTKGWPSLFNILPDRLRSPAIKRLLARAPRGIPGRLLTAFSGFGLAYARRLKKTRTRSEVTQLNLWAGSTFAQLVAGRDWGHVDGMYAFNGAALEIIKESHLRGATCAVEQTIAARETQLRLIRGEEQRFPQWTTGFTDDSFAAAAIERQHAEWQMADQIVCGSQFVRDSISECGGPTDKCVVVPYGFQMCRQLTEQRQHTRNRPLHILSAGAVGLRKGSPYVLEIAKSFRQDVQVRMVGSIDLAPSVTSQLSQYVELTGAVPRSEMATHWQWADILLLPSICEGSAAVVYEALSAGRPVICTPNTGSVVRDGMDGFVVPIRDTTTISDRIEKLANDRDLLRHMSRNARLRATEYDLSRYGERLIGALESN